MSALITAAIVIAWLAVLVPLLLERAAARSAAQDRLATAMRVLSGRGRDGSGRRWSVAPGREAVDLTADGEAAADASGPAPVRATLDPAVAERLRRTRAEASAPAVDLTAEGSTPDEQAPEAEVAPTAGRARLTAAQRRTRVFAAALALAAVTGLVAAVRPGAATITVQVAADAILVAVLGGLRGVARREVAVRAARARRAQLLRDRAAALLVADPATLALRDATRRSEPLHVPDDWAEDGRQAVDLRDRTVELDAPVDRSWELATTRSDAPQVVVYATVQGEARLAGAVPVEAPRVAVLPRPAAAPAAERRSPADPTPASTAPAADRGTTAGLTSYRIAASQPVPARPAAPQQQVDGASGGEPVLELELERRSS
jgi:hypothetical protein